MSQFMRIASTEVNLTPLRTLFVLPVTFLGSRMLSVWRRAGRGVRILLFAGLAFVITVASMDLTGRSFPVRVGSHEVGLCPWVPFEAEGFIEQMSGPALVDYSDGSCALIQGTRIGCFYWEAITIPVGCGSTS